MEAAKISMIALDLDGTCLDSTGKMVDRTRNILEYYGEKGTQIVFTTGRPIAGILKELRTISGTNYAIALNGGMVYELLDERTIYKKSIDREEVLLVRDIVLKHDVLTDVASSGVGFGDKKTYDNAGKYIKNDDFRNYYLSSRGAKKELWENIEKLESVEKINMFFSDMEERRKVLEELKVLKTLFSNSFPIFFTSSKRVLVLLNVIILLLPKMCCRHLRNRVSARLIEQCEHIF